MSGDGERKKKECYRNSEGENLQWPSDGVDRMGARISGSYFSPIADLLGTPGRSFPFHVQLPFSLT